MKSSSMQRLKVSDIKIALLDKCQEYVDLLDLFGIEQDIDMSDLYFYMTKMIDLTNDIAYLKNRLLFESLKLIEK